MRKDRIVQLAKSHWFEIIVMVFFVAILIRLNDISYDVNRAVRYSSSAEDYAADAAEYAKDASNNADDALNYASDASDYAEYVAEHFGY